MHPTRKGIASWERLLLNFDLENEIMSFITLRRFGNSAPLALAALSIAGLIALPARAQTPTSNAYAFTDLDALASSEFGAGSTSTATAIYNGTIVGYGSGGNTNSDQYAVLWTSGGGTKDLQAGANYQLGGTHSGTVANGIAAYTNNKGYNIAGYGYGDMTSGKNNALLWSGTSDFQSANYHSLLATTSIINRDVDLGSNSSSVMTAISSYTIQATGARGYNQVGYASGSNTNYQNVAVRYNTDNTITSLQKQAFYSLGFGASTSAYGVEEFVSVGSGFGQLTSYQANALRWNADGSVTNLATVANLAIGSSSEARGIAGGIVVGYGNGVPGGTGSNALRWNVDGSVTNLHSFLASSGINLGAGATSYANGIAGGITVGYGEAPSSPASANVSVQLTDSALRWNADGSALSLQRFVTGGATTSVAKAIDPITGIIVGSAGNKACSWTPLGAGAGGANSLAVPTGATTTITQDFTQTNGSTVVNGVLVLSDGSGADGTKTLNLAGGILGGSGTVKGNVVNAGGTVSPGNSPGNLTINGNYTQTAGNLLMQVAGTGAGQFDQVTSTGTATLGGVLDIVPYGGFDFATLSVGQTFDVLSATNGINGTFGSVTPGWQFSTVNGGTIGRLTYSGVAAVPEANAGLLALLALPMLVVLRRRTRTTSGN